MSEFRRIIDIPPVQLYIEDLIALEDIMKQDVPENSHFRIKLTMNHDFNNFINSFKEIIDGNLTDTITGMKIEFWTKDEMQKDISLTFGRNYADYQIASPNHTWYLGKINQLNEFFKRKKPWYSLLVRGMPFIEGLLIPFVIFCITYSFMNHNIILVASSVILLLLLSVIAFYNYKGRIFSYIRISLRSKPKHEFSYELFSLIFSGLSFIIALIGLMRAK